MNQVQQNEKELFKFFIDLERNKKLKINNIIDILASTVKTKTEYFVSQIKSQVKNSLIKYEYVKKNNSKKEPITDLIEFVDERAIAVDFKPKSLHLH